MRRLLRENSLSVAMFGIFFLILIGQFATGLDESNSDREQHGMPPRSAAEYVTSGHFVEAVFENWESEFLQMGAFVLFTIKLRQRGSSESKQIYGEEEVDREPDPKRKDVPWPVRRGGLVLKLYENSLAVALLALFVLSLALHAIGGATVYSEEQIAHGEPGVTALGYLTTSRMWFESLQNWQSEFLSIGVLIVFSVFFRQKGSAESKPVDAPRAETGSSP
jgi:hypothetical protein